MYVDHGDHGVDCGLSAFLTGDFERNHVFEQTDYVSNGLFKSFFITTSSEGDF